MSMHIILSLIIWYKRGLIIKVKRCCGCAFFFAVGLMMFSGVLNDNHNNNNKQKWHHMAPTVYHQQNPTLVHLQLIPPTPLLPTGHGTDKIMRSSVSLDKLTARVNLPVFALGLSAHGCPQ